MSIINGTLRIDVEIDIADITQIELVADLIALLKRMNAKPSTIPAKAVRKKPQKFNYPPAPIIIEEDDELLEEEN